MKKDKLSISFDYNIKSATIVDALYKGHELIQMDTYRNCPNCHKRLSESGGALDRSMTYYTCWDCGYKEDVVKTIEQ